MKISLIKKNLVRKLNLLVYVCVCVWGGGGGVPATSDDSQKKNLLESIIARIMAALYCARAGLSEIEIQVRIV